jgi:hypothetical protein
MATGTTHGGNTVVVNPLRAVGQVMRWRPGETPTFLGSCFALRWNNRYVTAAHCIANVPSQELAVRNPAGGLLSSVTKVERHETADIAVISPSGLQVGGFETEPFWDVVSNWSLGEDFMAYGYPADVLGPQGDRPTERLFRGHFQRFMRYESHLGFAYLAAEMSIPAPAGLSGGPLFRPGAHSMLVAMATENLQSTTFLEEVQIEERPGYRVEKRYERVIAYGVALVLSDVSDWLDAAVPPRDPASIAEGGASVVE